MGVLYGKTVLITGASAGIGAESARIFAKAGANVVLFARSQALLEALAEEIGAQALVIVGDVSRYEDVSSAVAKAKQTFGTLDILINNAGVIEPISNLVNSDPTAWTAAIDINLNGVYYGIRAALPDMQAARSGTIITVSSGAAHNPLEGWSHYCASKAGAAMITQAAHLESEGHGVRIMGLSPGTVATQMQKDIKSSGVNPVSEMDWSDHVPADWPARALLWMCTGDADEFNGQEVLLRDEEIRRRAGIEG